MISTAPARATNRVSHRKRVAGAALAVTLALTAAACGSSAKGQESGPGYNMAEKSIVNPTTKTGGTITLTSAQSGGFDSLDPGNTYQAQTWNLFRTFGRSMLSWTHQPGAAGEQLQGDLAEGPGVASPDGLTWTYKIRAGATFEDGTKITSKDVMWAIERSGWDSENHADGPTYFNTILTPDDGKTAPYAGGKYNVYKQPDLPDTIIGTPDDQTIVFHLPHPFGEFDYLMTLPQTYPVPYRSDVNDPIGYANRPKASGAYKIKSYTAGKELVLVKNEAYNEASDPEHQHKAFVDTIDVKLGLSASDRDQMLLSGQADLDINNPLTVASHAQVLTDPVLKSQVDDTADGSLTYAALNQSVIKDYDCRKAIELGIDKEAVLNEVGGSYGGNKATSMLTAAIPGHVAFDAYGGYQPDEARKSMEKCDLATKGPDGKLHFKTNIAVQSNNPDLDNVATAIQASLKTVGIDTEIQLIPSNRYYSAFAGETNYANSNKLGIILSTWVPDWPSGYGFLDQIVTRAGIAPPGVGGSVNVAQYHSDAVDKLFAQALATSDKTKQQEIWARVDKQVMADAIGVPLVERKVLTFRSARLGNVLRHAALGGYDLSYLGLK